MEPKIALLCSGLGNIKRGHEIFAQDLFDLLKNDLDITLFKGGGEAGENELVVPNFSRRSSYLNNIKAFASPKWADSIREQEKERIEALTFAYAAIKPLVEGGYNIIHCLEREVCETVFKNKHLFEDTPRVIFSNGGAIRPSDLPSCDYVQEHTDYNFSRSAKHKAFMIPHGVDIDLFHVGIDSDFRLKHGIPEDAFVVISVGTICYWHKRMDHVIREVAMLDNVYLVIVGQESDDSPAIRALGEKLLGDRVVFTTLTHADLPQAYAAADVFVLGSLFETFGIVYIEAMAMGLPVVCTNHPNQKGVVKEGIFIDMSKAGVLADTLRNLDPSKLESLKTAGPSIVNEHYDLKLLRSRYVSEYGRISAAAAHLKTWSVGWQVLSNVKNMMKQFRRMLSN